MMLSLYAAFEKPFHIVSFEANFGYNASSDAGLSFFEWHPTRALFAKVALFSIASRLS